LNWAISGKTRRLNMTMKEKLDWFEKYQQQKEKRMKKLLPGKTLAKDFIEPRGLTPDQVAKDIVVPGVTARHMNEIVQGRRAVTFEILFGLEQYFGSSVLEWRRTLLDLYEMERFAALCKSLSAGLKPSLALYKSLLALLKRSAARDKSLLADVKQSAALYKSFSAESKECPPLDKWLSAELKKSYALAKPRLRALLRSSR
jgi:plasmid maintenance system antidote protein VapI